MFTVLLISNCCQVISGISSGLMSILPERIQAIDTDTSRAAVRYSFDDGTPSNYRDFFEIHPNTGWVRQSKPVNRSEVTKFDLLVKVLTLKVELP